MNSWRFKLLAGAVVATLLVFAVLFLTRSVAQVALVKRGMAPNSKPGSVTVQAEYEMDLKSEVGGRLIRSELDPGKTVKTGAFLAQIDTGDLQLEIEHIASEYEAAKQRIAIGSQIALDLATARENLENYERLTKSGNYAEADLIKQRRSVEKRRCRNPIAPGRALRRQAARCRCCQYTAGHKARTCASGPGRASARRLHPSA